MRAWTPVQILSQAEEARLHETAMRIMAEVGFLVESGPMLGRLEAAGARVDKGASRAWFPQEFMESFLAESERFDWSAVEPSVGGHSSAYCGYYLNPETNRHEPWTLPTLLGYFKVAHYLPHVRADVGLPFRLTGVPDAALVLFFHYLTFKLTGRSGSGLNNVRYCPHVLEMCEEAAGETGGDVQDVFSGYVHLISPLKLGHEEAEIFTFFADRGVRVAIGSMSSVGGTGPVTLAGTLALHLAQQLFLNVVMRAYFGDRRIWLGCSISPLDMRTGMYAYGRPEKELCNVAMAQMARRYGASYGGHCGHSDAKRPGSEAGFQKALNSIPTLLACGRTAICCGLLSVDEVFSPVQMVIDDEMVAALQRFARGFEVSDETLAFEVIKAVGPGGNFLGEEHTARHVRGEIWHPQLFSHSMFAGWQRGGCKTDVDMAAEVCRDIMKRDPVRSRISDALESRLLNVICRATGAVVQPVSPL